MSWAPRARARSGAPTPLELMANRPDPEHLALLVTSACVQRRMHAAPPHCMRRYLLESELGDELGGDLVRPHSHKPAVSVCCTKGAAAVTLGN